MTPRCDARWIISGQVHTCDLFHRHGKVHKCGCCDSGYEGELATDRDLAMLGEE